MTPLEAMTPMQLVRFVDELQRKDMIREVKVKRDLEPLMPKTPLSTPWDRSASRLCEPPNEVSRWIEASGRHGTTKVPVDSYDACARADHRSGWHLYMTKDGVRVAYRCPREVIERRVEPQVEEDWR